MQDSKHAKKKNKKPELQRRERERDGKEKRYSSEAGKVMHGFSEAILLLGTGVAGAPRAAHLAPLRCVHEVAEPNDLGRGAWRQKLLVDGVVAEAAHGFPWPARAAAGARGSPPSGTASVHASRPAVSRAVPRATGAAPGPRRGGADLGRGDYDGAPPAFVVAQNGHSRRTGPWTRPRPSSRRAARPTLRP